MHIHILGIVGTMTAHLAVSLKKRGFRISGSDQEKIFPPISTTLKRANIPVNSTEIDNNIDLAIIGSSYNLFENTKKEFEEIKKDLDKYGIRNTTKTSKPPLEKPSTMISDTISGIEPFFLKNLKLI